MCGEDGATEDDTLELLTGLVDKSMVIMRSGIDSSRYGVLETLRAYGRDRLQENGIGDRMRACGMRVYFTELAERAAAGMHGADERRGSCGCCPTTTTCAQRSSMPLRTGTSTSRFGW